MGEPIEDAALGLGTLDLLMSLKGVESLGHEGIAAQEKQVIAILAYMDGFLLSGLLYFASRPVFLKYGHLMVLFAFSF